MKFKKTKQVALLALVSVASVASMQGQERVEQDSPRPIMSRYTLEVGRRHALSTYLSPIVYHGVDFTLGGEWRKKMPFDPRWEMAFQGKLGFSNMENMVKNASMQMFEASFSWGMERMWSVGGEWKIGAGGSVSADGGVLYLARNSNNPANAMARVGLNLTGSVAKPFKIGRLKVTGFDQLSLPTVGIFFSPEYGETYYEIYLGNRKGLIHCGWWGNNFCLDNLLGTELHFGKRSLVLGWRFDMYTTHANNLDTQLWRHSGVIGLKF